MRGPVGTPAGPARASTFQSTYYINKVPKVKFTPANREMVCFNVFPIFSLLVLHFAATLAQKDRTLEDEATGSDVVIATVNRIQSSGVFPDDYQFLRRMARVETNDGETLSQTTGGIWNIDSSPTWRKVQSFMKVSEERHQLQMQIQLALGITWNSTFPTYGDLKIPLYSALAVLVRIQSLKETIPDDIFGQADLWQRQFNNQPTTLTKDDFISNATALQREQSKINYHSVLCK